MDTDRASKRRKLEQDIPHSTPASKKSRKPVTYSSKKPGFQIRSSPRTEPVSNGTTPRKSAHEAWEEAKAKSLARRHLSRAPETDIYDDIDGAHPSPQKKAASALKLKAKLDPLRNQSASSPIKKAPPSSAATVGFFKQFHNSKVDSARSTPKQDGEAEKSVNGHAQDESLSSESDAETGVVVEQDHADRKESPVARASGRARRAPTTLGNDVGDKPSGVATEATGRIKTFEDEIREVEEAAKKQAAEEDGGDAPSVLSAKRRSSGRRQGDTKPAEAGVERPRPQQRPSGKVKKPAERRRANRANHVEPHMDMDVEPSDAMEVDDSEHEVSSAKATPERRAHLVDQPGVGMNPAADAMEIDKSENERAVPQQAVSARKTDTTKVPTTPSKRSTQHALKTKSASGQQIIDPEDLASVQQLVLEKLTGKRPIPLTHLADEYAKVSALITQTVTAGESNSMLLIGARGSGKTALVSQIVCEQAVEHADDFLVVRLNGFVHTDDKVALREIWRQLGREMDVEDEEGPARNYADTLTTLLALLSHPAEQGLEQPDQVTKSVIFILDEFELFASHPRQTLLYNLFDIAQSRKAPIVVLGLTTRVDVSEALEKRVKSRFSHRYVHLSLAKSFAAFRETCKACLSVQTNELSMAGETRPDSACKGWVEMTESLLSTEVFTNHLRRLYYTTKSVPDFMASMLVPLATLPTEEALDTDALIEHFKTSLPTSSLGPPDSRLTLLASLGNLQLALLICAARLTAIHNTEVISFALAYEEYKVLASKARLQASAHGSMAHGAGARISSKDVAKNAWEDLVECGLVMYDGGRGGGRVDVGLEELGMSGVELGQWGRWCKEI